MTSPSVFGLFPPPSLPPGGPLQTMGVQEWGIRTWGGDNNITPGIRYIFETLFRILFPQKLFSTFFAQNWTWRISGLLFSSRGSGVVGSLLVCQGPPLPPFTLSLTQRPSLSLLFFFSGEVLSEHSLSHEYIFSPSLLLSTVPFPQFSSAELSFCAYFMYIREIESFGGGGGGSLSLPSILLHSFLGGRMGKKASILPPPPHLHLTASLSSLFSAYLCSAFERREYEVTYTFTKHALQKTVGSAWHVRFSA